jgi:hypothetical protein
MRKRELKVGDFVKVIKYRPGKYAPGVTDELGTEDLFRSMVGKRYRVGGFDQYGHIELRPKPMDTIWIEADLVEFAAPQTKGQNITPRSSRRRVRPAANRKRSARRD